MPCRLLYGYDKEVAFWVAEQLGVSGWLGDYRAIGVIRGGKLIAGVVYYAYRHPNIEMAVAAIDPQWATRKNLKAFFSYPFIELGCKRVTGLVDTDNRHARKIDERLGFVHEATLKDAHPNGDAEIYRMLKTECRWIDG
jgi:RimJ/RimL family protein N-acetyltransferase